MIGKAVKPWSVTIAAALLCTGGFAHAESAAVTAGAPAPAREVAMTHSIAIDRIGGTDGMQLSLALERLLAQPGANGQPYFDLLAGRRGADSADVILEGVVTTGVDEGRVKLTRNRCIDEQDGKCAKREDVELDCRRRIIDVRADVRVATGEEGRVLYSEAKPQRRESSWCPGDDRPAPTEQLVSAMIETIAAQIHADLVPRESQVNVRFREGRKGMGKSEGERFKQAIRLTQRDLPGACGEFRAIEAAMPGHPSTAFNLALCAEAAGDLAAAEAAYRRAQAIEPRAGDIREALDRIAATMAMRADLAQRAAL
ncbi:hypothetical protein [Sphingomonas japonica]|uniref:Tetratricopeptide repeat-containing protein n=1 Tax=Sphingomonas japonica TaxID=511662 RepID=A0ABX0U2V5_9SPHN|nr:hypothetical protein [Sphingomonas japonica]NIJ23652.1 hypothetical protein [Sphingomonas japonica]